jgi:two-component system, response regulator / RNA-binding antiterminator
MKSFMIVCPDPAFRLACDHTNKLASMGMEVIHSHPPRNLSLKDKFAGIVLCASFSMMKEWIKNPVNHHEVPIWWWCNESDYPTEIQFELDGILTCSMSSAEIQWSLALGDFHFKERNEAIRRIESLEEKLEERKLIDKAKGILTSTLKLTEAEAYTYLRNQAMKERKKITDICHSIILLHEPLLKPVTPMGLTMFPSKPLTNRNKVIL